MRATEPDLGEAARRDNFTNEIGALGGIRPSQPGRRGWSRAAGRRGATRGRGARRRAAVDEPDALLDVADPRFLHPADMLAEVTGALGLPVDAPPPVVVRGIVESQAAGPPPSSTASAPAARSRCSGAASGRPSTCAAPPTGVGGGHRRPVEATVLGNALVQGVALGFYTDGAEARGEARR